MNEHTLNFKEAVTELAKSSPPMAVVAAGLATKWTLNDFLTAVTIVYVILQIGWLAWRWYQAARMPAGSAGSAGTAAAADE